MSFYSSIDRRINADAWFRELSHLAQLLWFRLLTGQHVTPVAGLWPALEEQLSRSFKMPLPLFRKLYAELSTDKNGSPNGKVLADWDAGVIWFPNAINVPANQPKNDNSLRGWVKHLELVPECELRDLALIRFADWVVGNGQRFPQGLPKGFPEPSTQPLPERLRKPFGKHVPRAQQEQEQEQDPNQDQKQEQEHQSVGNRPRLTNLSEALQVEIRLRCQILLEDSHLGEYLQPDQWPEIREIAEPLAKALDQPFVLGTWPRDSALRALVECYAAGLSKRDLLRVTEIARTEPWWRKERRGLSALTVEVARRTLAAAPPLASAGDTDIERALRTAERAS